MNKGYKDIYFRRWTRMHFRPALQMFYKYGVLRKSKLLQQAMQWCPTIESQLPFPQRKMSKENKQLVQTLVKKYPDLKYEPFFRTQNYLQSRFKTTFDYAYNFIKLQKLYMKNGFTKQQAFKMAEEKYQKRINRKLNQTLLSRALAFSNKARSFMSLYQQQLEFESRIKAQRLARELKKYQEKIEIEKELEKEQEKDDGQVYERLIDKIVRKDEKEYPAQQFEGQKRQKFLQRFEKKSSEIFSLYFHQIETVDKLSVLSDQEILREVTATPSKLKKSMSMFLNKILKQGIRLNKFGDISFEKCRNPLARKKYQGDPYVKIALLTHQLQYQFPHLQKQKQKAYKLKLQYNLFTRLDKLKSNQVQTQQIDLQSKLEYKKTIKDIFLDNQSTYRLFQTYQQKTYRLQIKWLQAKIMILENPQFNNQLIQKLKQVIAKLRRLKYRLQQKNYRFAKYVFEQHHLIQRKEFNLEQYNYENLIDYMMQKKQQRWLTNQKKMQDLKSMSYVIPKNYKQAIDSDVNKLQFYDFQNYKKDTMKQKIQDQYQKIKKLQELKEQKLKKDFQQLERKYFYRQKYKNK